MGRLFVPRMAIAAAAMALAAASCTQGPSSVAGGDRTGATSSRAVAEVLGFEAPLLDGGTFVGADHAGKDLAFWFWAPW